MALGRVALPAPHSDSAAPWGWEGTLPFRNCSLFWTCPELRLWFAGMSSAEEPSSLHPSAACGFANEASRGPGSLPAKESGDSRLWGPVQAPAVPSPGRPRPGEASAPRPLGENPKGRRGAGRPSPYCGHCACTQLLSCPTPCSPVDCSLSGPLSTGLSKQEC